MLLFVSFQPSNPIHERDEPLHGAYDVEGSRGLRFAELPDGINQPQPH